MADHAAPCGYRRYVASLAPIALVNESSKLSIREGHKLSATSRVADPSDSQFEQQRSLVHRESFGTTSSLSLWKILFRHEFSLRVVDHSMAQRIEGRQYWHGWG